MTLATMEEILAHGFTRIGASRCVRHPDFKGVLFVMLRPDDDLELLNGFGTIVDGCIAFHGGKYKNMSSITGRMAEAYDGSDGDVSDRHDWWVPYPPMPDTHTTARAVSRSYTILEKEVDLSAGKIFGMVTAPADVIGFMNLGGLTPTRRAIGEPNGYSTVIGIPGEISVTSALFAAPRMTRPLVRTLSYNALVKLANELPAGARTAWFDAAISSLDSHIGDPRLNLSVIGFTWFNGVLCGGVGNNSAIMGTVGAGGYTTKEDNPATDGPYPFPVDIKPFQAEHGTGKMYVGVAYEAKVVNTIPGANLKGAIYQVALDMEGAVALSPGVLVPGDFEAPIPEENLEASRKILGKAQNAESVTGTYGALALVHEAINYADATVAGYVYSPLYDWATWVANAR